MVPSQRKVLLTVFPLELVGDTLDEDFTDELETSSEELEDSVSTKLELEGTSGSPKMSITAELELNNSSLDDTDSCPQPTSKSIRPAVQKNENHSRIRTILYGNIYKQVCPVK